MHINESFSLKNSVAVITGALGLLGRQHCYALAEAGANVIVCDFDDSKCIDFAKTLAVPGMGFGVDITNIELVKELKSKILNQFGKIDILVNNAAINDMFENPSMSGELSMF